MSGKRTFYESLMRVYLSFRYCKSKHNPSKAAFTLCLVPKVVTRLYKTKHCTVMKISKISTDLVNHLDSVEVSPYSVLTWQWISHDFSSFGLNIQKTELVLVRAILNTHHKLQWRLKSVSVMAVETRQHLMQVFSARAPFADHSAAAARSETVFTKITQ